MAGKESVINVPEWNDVFPQTVVFLSNTNQFINENVGGAGVFGFFMSVENPILFTQQEDQAYCEVEDTYIWDLNK